MNSKFTNIIDLKNFLENKENFEKFNFPEIAYYANNLVFSKGNPNAKILIIGEAPGEKEDISSIPFCGSCGKLLDSALRTFLNNPEDSVYFISSVFWRPFLINEKRKSNRKPTYEEIEWCRPYLFNHIELLSNIDRIIVLGLSAYISFKNLTKIDSRNIKISEIINKKIYSDKLSRHFYVNFHPAYILRNKKTLYKNFCDDLKSVISQN